MLENVERADVDDDRCPAGRAGAHGEGEEGLADRDSDPGICGERTPLPKPTVQMALTPEGRDNPDHRHRLEEDRGGAPLESPDLGEPRDDLPAVVADRVVDERD